MHNPESLFNPANLSCWKPTEENFRGCQLECEQQQCSFYISCCKIVMSHLKRPFSWMTLYFSIRKKGRMQTSVRWNLHTLIKCYVTYVMNYTTVNSGVCSSNDNSTTPIIFFSSYKLFLIPFRSVLCHYKHN